MLKRIKDIILELLFPKRCPVCDGVTHFGTDICPHCKYKLQYVGEDYCVKCGKSLKTTGVEYCDDCGTKSHVFDAGRSLYLYPSIRMSIYRFKYQNRQEYANFYGREIAEKLQRTIAIWNPDALVPVPLHSKKKRKRGYNQAELLANAIGKELNIPVYNKMVKREKETLPQKMLNQTERQINLKKAFKIAQNEVKLDTIVIVDDIYTTGSTIDSIAYELKKCGVKNVYYIALSIGESA